MTIWKFYKIPEGEVPSNINLVDKYPLYAITNDKKLFTRFKNDRNMKKFIIKKDWIDEDDYAMFANEHRSTVLREHKLNTEVKNKNKEVNMVLTMGEYTEVSESMLYLLEDIDLWNYLLDPFLLKKDFLNYLNKINYIDFYLLYKNLYNFSDDCYYDVPNLLYDELNFFIAMYGDILKNE